MSQPDTAIQGPGPLQTAWSVVLGARDFSGADRERMLNRLIGDYWRPVYRFIRHEWNATPEEARDLTQDYFVHFMEHDLLGDVSPEKGRFRSFVRVTLQRFLSNRRRAENAQKRGGGRRVLPIDWVQAEVDDATARASGPEEGFDRLWATTVLDAAIADLQRELESQGRGAAFEQFRICCLESPGATYREAAQRHSTTEGSVRNAIFAVRKRLRARVRERVRESVAHESLVDSEVAHLLRLLE